MVYTVLRKIDTAKTSLFTQPTREFDQELRQCGPLYASTGRPLDTIAQLYVVVGCGFDGRRNQSCLFLIVM